MTNSNRRAIVTVVTRNYAAYARVLMNYCQRYEPHVDRIVVVADTPPDVWRNEAKPYELVEASKLPIQNWNRFKFQYTPFELSCALKPHAIRYVLDRGYTEVAYLDGDMAIYGPLSLVWSSLERDSIVITPHLLKPLPIDGQRPHESAFLYSGTYNAGFFAVKNNSVTNDFITWWTEMVRQHCHVDLSSNIFVDQKWLCLVPGMFETVKILRNYGYNAGHWTLSQADIRPRGTDHVTESRVLIENDPLVLFHFSGMTPNKPIEYLTSQTRTSLDRIPELQTLVTEYQDQVRNAGLSECTAWGCEYDSLDDGTPIHAAWREAIRRNEKSFLKVQDPFSTTKNADLVECYRSIEAQSYKWRKDWRLKWDRSKLQKSLSKPVKSVTRRLKQFLNVFRSAA